MSPPLNLLCLSHYPILEQLRIEEALLRCSEENWCIINMGTPPAIVLGISGKEHELVDLPLAQKNNIPLIRRFSGGGCVVLDKDSLLITFLGGPSIPVSPYPETLLKWTETFYSKVFSSLPFSLQAQDYTLEDKKIGGNAQYLRKTRWLHHTSFLWDYKPELMNLLLLPKKIPNYRKKRSHSEFLTCLKSYFSSQEVLLKRITQLLTSFFDVQSVSLEKALNYTSRPHRKATTTIEQKELH